LKKQSVLAIAVVTTIAIAVGGVFFAMGAFAAIPQSSMPNQMNGFANSTYYPIYADYGMGGMRMGMGMNMMMPMYQYANGSNNYTYYVGPGMGMMPMGMMGSIYGYGPMLTNYTAYQGYDMGDMCMGMMDPDYYVNQTSSGYVYNYTYGGSYGMGYGMNYPNMMTNGTYQGYYGGCGMGMGMGSYNYGMNSQYPVVSPSPSPELGVSKTYNMVLGKTVYLSNDANSTSAEDSQIGITTSPYAVAGLGFSLLAIAPVTWKLMHRKLKS
jgi:hypothetical protein